MPTIPMINAKRNVTANPSAEFMRGENLIPFENQQKLISEADKVTRIWSQAHDVTQTNNAKVRYSMFLTDISARAAADPSVKLDEKGLPVFNNNSVKYLQEIEDAKRISTNGIDNQMVANSLNSQFNLEGFIAGAKIQNDFRQKELKFGDGETKKQFDILTAQILQADQNGQTTFRDQLMNQRNILTRQATMSGIWGPERAAKEEKAATSVIMKDKIYSDNSVTEPSSQLLASLKDKNKFIYLTPDERIDFIKELQIRIARNNQSALKASIQQQLDDRVTLLKGISSGQVDYLNPAVVTAVSQKDPVLGNVLINLKNQNGQYLPLGSTNDVINAMSFAQAAKENFKNMNPEQINKWLEKSVSNLKTTQGDVNKLGILAQMAIEQAAALRPTAENQKIVSDHFQVRDVLDWFQMAIPYWSPVATERFLIRKYGINLNGESIKKEGNKVIKEIINEVYPETQGLPGIPNKIMDSTGSLDSIYEGPNELDGEEHGPATDSTEPATGDNE